MVFVQLFFMEEFMFRLENVRYKNILYVAHLDIPSYKITSIVGESGSGKTTLLKLLNRMISQTEGKILFNNQEITSIDPVELRRRIVMLPQSPVIFKGNVRENLITGLKFSQKPIPDDNKLAEALRIVYLNKSLEEMPDNFSGGEKQRLCLARVLLMDPDVLLLDEPSSALDENMQFNIISQLSNFIKSNKKTVVMVTHSLKIAQLYSDYIIEIKNGNVVSQTQTEGLFDGQGNSN